jgi:hypothetical protein
MSAAYVKQRLAEISTEFGKPPVYVVAGTFSQARDYVQRRRLSSDWRYVSYHEPPCLQLYSAAGEVHFAGTWHRRPDLPALEQRVRFLMRTHPELWSVVGREFNS